MYFYATLVILLVVLSASCGTPAVTPVTPSDLTRSAWTETTAECYNSLVRLPTVIGMQQDGKYFLKISTLELAE